MPFKANTIVNKYIFTAIPDGGGGRFKEHRAHPRNHEIYQSLLATRLRPPSQNHATHTNNSNLAKAPRERNPNSAGKKERFNPIPRRSPAYNGRRNLVAALSSPGNLLQSTTHYPYHRLNNVPRNKFHPLSAPFDRFSSISNHLSPRPAK